MSWICICNFATLIFLDIHVLICIMIFFATGPESEGVNCGWNRCENWKINQKPLTATYNDQTHIVSRSWNKQQLLSNVSEKGERVRWSLIR